MGQPSVQMGDNRIAGVGMVVIDGNRGLKRFELSGVRP